MPAIEFKAKPTVIDGKSAVKLPREITHMHCDWAAARNDLYRIRTLRRARAAGLLPPIVFIDEPLKNITIKRGSLLVSVRIEIPLELTR